MNQLSQKVDNLYDMDNFFIKICDLYSFELLLPKTPYSSNIVLYLGQILGQYAGMNCWRSFFCSSLATEL
jgi:hypothetical protein